MEALKSIALPPGFGFHPTDVELISHYLKRKNQGLKVDFEVIPELDIYKREPWDLPACCQIPTRDSKWHFFTSRDRKYPNGSRSNRATEAGYWKSTGKDRNIRLHNQIIGTKKTLVFHQGRPPYGKRTDWIMHEYYMDEKESKTTPGIKDSYVLCRITKRNGFAVEGEKLSPRTKEVDCQKFVNDMDASLQEGVVQEESSPSASTEDLDAWFEELFDPNFDGSIKSNVTDLLPACTEPKLELQTGLSTLVPKNEPLDFSFLPEEIKGILHDDFTDMPDITELLKFDCNSTLSPNQQMKFGTEDFKKKIPSPPENAKFTGIRLRRRYGPAAENLHHRIKLQVQTSKMESRNSASVCQTFESAHVNHCISSNSKPRHPPNLEVDSKFWFRKTKLNCIRGFAKEFWRFFSRCLTDRIGSCFWRVCLIGTAALFIYFLLHNCPRFLENFPALGL